MLNFLINRTKNEDGAVLITSLLFLMIVTVISIIGIQSPKTDMMISGNEKLSVQSQQLANIGIMEAKNWLAIRFKPDEIPLNAKGKTSSGDEKYFVVARPDANLDSKFLRMGLLNKDALTINFETEVSGNVVSSLDKFNTPKVGGVPATGPSTIITSTLNRTLKNSEDKELATYDWSIVRISSVGAISDPDAQELNSVDMNTYIASLGNTVAQNFSIPNQITEGYNVLLDESTAFWQYFHISSTANSNGLITQSEAIASYKQVIPATN